MSKHYGWTQPICAFCYAMRYPDETSPVRLKDPVYEHCVDCGKATFHGLYIRVDPVEAKYPSLIKE